MIPASAVKRHEGNARTDQSSRQQGLLAKRVPPVGIANCVGFLVDVESGLSFFAADDLQALLIELIDRQGWVGDAGVIETHHRVDALTDLLSRTEAAIGQSRGNRDITHAKAGTVGIVGTTNGAYLLPKKFGPPDRDIRGSEK